MGHKIHPRIFRTGILYQWHSKWFSSKHFPELLRQDIQIKDFLRKKLKEASVATIEIERSPNSTTVTIHSGKPGMIIGRGGQGIEDLRKEVKRRFLDAKMGLNLTIQEITDPNASADLVAQSIAIDLEKRIPFRRAMKQALGRVERSNVKGIKITVSGRLNGAEIARTETLVHGSMPLHTLRADIDYAQGTAFTTYGAIGIKIWLYKGEKFDRQAEPVVTPERKPAPRARRPFTPQA
jgi:small subunit ribosomal protein S3